MQEFITPKKPSNFLLAFFATFVRFYDYALFGLSASAISSELMPKDSVENQFLLFYIILAFSMFARPLGAIIFGYIADIQGRSRALRITTIISMTSTTMVALIPNYEKIGIVSVVLLVITRMLFIMSLAAESDSIKIYITEMMNRSNRELGVSLVNFFSQAGVLFASLLFFLSNEFIKSDSFWRANFIIGGFMGAIIIWQRNKFTESQLFLNSYVKHRKKKKCEKIWQLFLDYKWQFIVSIIATGVIGGIYNFLIIFLNVFLGNVAKAINPTDYYLYNNISITIYMSSLLLSGLLSLYIRIYYRMLFALITSISLTSLLIGYIDYFNQINIILIWSIIFIVPFFNIGFSLISQSIFPTELRVRMYSLSHAIGSLIFSSATPLISTLIWKSNKSLSQIFSFLLIQLIILLGCYFYLSHCYKKTNFFEIEEK